MALSKIRTNFHSSSEALINKQINMELHASYVYMSMVSFKAGLFPKEMSHWINVEWSNIIQGIYDVSYLK